MKSIISWLRRRGKSQIPAREGASDGLSRLPLELHFYVLEHLDVQDLALAIDVCRSWRYIWLSDEVWPTLAARWFPGLYEQIRLTTAAGQRSADAFRHFLIRYRLRNNGRFSHALQYNLKFESDQVYRLNKNVPVKEGGIHSYADARESDPDLERFARFRLYCHGRIAWWPEPYALPYIAVVDDLRTKSRRVYCFPNHHMNQVGYQTALGDKLFIMGNERTLHAWHLDTDTHQSIVVPYPFKRCVTEKETVVIIARDSAVYIWKFGDSLRQVDMSLMFERNPVTWGDQGDFVPSVLGPHRVGLSLRWSKVAIDFIVHPAIENLFFVVTLLKGALNVHEVNDGQLVQTHTMGEEHLSKRALASAGQLRWEKIDSKGGYNLLSIYPVPRGSPHDDDGLEDLCREISCRCQTQWGVEGHTLVSVCFNVYTRTFQVLRHQPDSLYQARAFHIWNQQLLCAGRPHGSNRWHIASYEGNPDWSERKALVSLKFYSTTRGKPSKSHIRTRRLMSPEELGLFGLGTGAKAFHDIGYFLDANHAHTRHRIPSQQQVLSDTLRLVGDDNFLVFFEEGTYTVWCFGDLMVE